MVMALGIAIGIIIRVSKIGLDRINRVVERFFGYVIYPLVFLIGIGSGYIIRDEFMANRSIVMYVIRDIAVLLGLTLYFTIVIGIIVLRRIKR